MISKDIEENYFRRYPEVRILAISALEHYIKYGQRLGYELDVPRFLLDDFQDQELNQKIIAQDNFELIEEATNFHSQVPDISALSVFDSDFYLASNSDVAAHGFDPSDHYFSGGWRESRDPNGWFSTKYYLTNYQDVWESGIEPLQHYVQRGRVEGRYPSFAAWHADRASRQLLNKTSNFRLQRQTSYGASCIETKIAVHVHCFYLDVFTTDILKIVRKLPLCSTYFVSACNIETATEVAKQLSIEGVNIGRIAVVQNRGRDIAPLIIEFAADLLDFELCLHIHTKKSAEKIEIGSRWLRDIKRTLFPSIDFITNTIRLMITDSSIGLVGPRPYPEMRRFMVWGANAHIAKELIARTNSTADLPETRLLDFPAGSFFWFKPEAFQTLFKLNLLTNDFPVEPIPDDGTTAHAIERLLPVFTEQTKLRYVEVEPAPFEANPIRLTRPNVSIIIPVYNAERFIEAAILSVINRTTFHYTFEILAVDNNSTDSSRSVLDRLAQLFPEVKVISQPIRGAGAARNAGMDQAKGEYIFFLDADDLVTPDCIGNLYDCMYLGGEGETDFATSSLQMFSDLGLSHAMPFEDNGTFNILKKTDYETTSALWQAVMQDFGSCAKMYRTTFIKENNIHFPEGLNFEDNAFIGKAFLRAEVIVILNKVTYLYRKTEVGATQSTSISKVALSDQAKVIEIVIKDCDLLNGHSRNQDYLELLLNKLRYEAERMALINELPLILSGLPFLTTSISKSKKWSLKR